MAGAAEAATPAIDPAVDEVAAEENLVTADEGADGTDVSSDDEVQD